MMEMRMKTKNKTSPSFRERAASPTKSEAAHSAAVDQPVGRMRERKISQPVKKGHKGVPRVFGKDPFEQEPAVVDVERLVEAPDVAQVRKKKGKVNTTCRA